jgi:hypothetical protein
VSIGLLTKQLAQQALSNQVKDVVDALRPADAAATAEALAGARAAAPGTGDNVGALIVGQIQAMQNALKEDQELVVLCSTSLDVLRVLEVFMPSWRVAVLTGIDTEKVITRVISPVESLQLTCKAMPVQAGAKPARVRIVAPKPPEKG